MHIAINESDTFDKSFELDHVPEVGELFRYQLNGEVTKIYEVTRVDPPPAGLKGRVSHQVVLQVQQKRPGDQTLVPLVEIETID